MSTAVLQQVLETPAQPGLDNSQASVVDDPHPLVPVFVFGVIALACSLLVVGTFIALLALRPTGIFAAF